MSGKLFIVLFPPGAGGNHLANLISTAIGLKTRENLEYLYSSGNTTGLAHNPMGEIHNTLQQKDQSFFENTVLPMHLVHYSTVGPMIEAIARSNDIEVYHVFIDILGVDAQNELVKRRLFGYNSSVSSMIDDLGCSYRMIAKTFDNAYMININDLMTDDSTRLTQFIRSLGLTVNEKLIKNYHDLWIQIISKSF